MQCNYPCSRRSRSYDDCDAPSQLYGVCKDSEIVNLLILELTRMKCPNCGQEIQPDHLYCERCGMEIRIVPDFEPEIENSINETLSTVAEEIDNKSSKTSEETGNNKEWEESDEILTEEAGKNWLVFKMVSLIAVILIAVSFTLLMYFNYSTSFPLFY